MYKTMVVLQCTLAVLASCSNRSDTKEELFKAGMQELQAQNPAAAVIYLKRTLEKDPTSVDARFQLARAYSQAGKYESAEKELQKVLMQRPGAREVRRELARALALGGRPGEALGVIDHMGGAANGNAEELEIAGWAHALKGQFEAGIADLNKALALQPGRVSTETLLARAYLLSGKTEAARARVTDLLKREPSNRSALSLLAEVQVRERHPEAALQTYDAILKIMPDDGGASFRKGMLLLGLGRSAEALALAENLINDFPARPDGYELKGVGLFREKKFREAIPAFQKALSQGAAVGNHYFLGLCHYYSGELEQAMNQMQRLRTHDPALTNARVVTALIYLKKNKLDEAVDELRSVVAGNDRHAIAHSLLGNAYLSQGRYAEGLAELNRALQIDPKLVTARVTKGKAQLSRGRTDEAESELGAALRIDPDLLNSRLLLAASYLKRNQPGKAIAAAQQGLRNKRSDALLHNVIADALLRQRRTGEARNALEQARLADPDYAVTYLKIAALHQLAGEPEKALLLLKTFAESSPANAQAHLVAASLHEKSGKDREAAVFYEQARRTGAPEALLESARYHFRSRRPEQAFAVLDEGLKKNPGSPPLNLVKGQAALANSRFKEALQAFEQLAQQGHAAGLPGVIETYLAMNRPEQALDRVRRELGRNSDRQELRAELSRIYLRMGKKAEALENALRMVRDAPGAAIGYLALAAVHERSGEHEKAIDVLKKARPADDANLALALGNLYAARKQYSPALAQYSRGEALEPGSARMLFQKASLLHAMGSRKQAIAEYKRVLNLSEDHVPALNNLAYLLAEDRETVSAAVQYAVRAAVLAPGAGAVQDTMGFVLLKTGKIDAGLQSLRQAVRAVPDNPSIHYHLALALNERKDRSGAVASLEKALGLGEFPERVQAKAMLGTLQRGTALQQNEEPR